MISLFLSLMIATSGHAASPVKECKISMKQLDGDKNVKMNIQIFAESNGTYQAKVTNQVEGEAEVENTDSVSFEQMAVVENGMKKDPYQDKMTKAESILAHAHMLETDPVFQGMFSSGVYLTEVRFVKLYTIGKETKFGSATVVEAYDSKGVLMGSFLGGFLVSPCLNK